MRTMMFIDGENLTARFQAMKEDGRRPTTIIHEKDVFVWHGNLTSHCEGLELTRVYYYASASGDGEALNGVRDRVSGIGWHIRGGAKCNVVPRVFHKPIKEKKSRHLDIAITIDVLRHAFQDHLDAVFIVSGDGDFVPLVKEVMARGKRAFVGALSSGLNPEIRRTVDAFHNLDNDFFYRKEYERAQ